MGLYVLRAKGVSEPPYLHFLLKTCYVLSSKVITFVEHTIIIKLVHVYSSQYSAESDLFLKML